MEQTNKLDQKLKKLLVKRKKPLVGNNRSFSNRATKRKFFGNVQKFKIGKKIYKITAREYRNLLI